MKLTDFQYDLPEELIAFTPCEQRTGSRLLCLHKGKVTHKHFYDLPDLLKPNDLLVFNNSRVIPARIFATKETGGKAEILIERILSATEAVAHIRANKSPKPGTVLRTQNNILITVTGRTDDLFNVALTVGKDWLSLLNEIGHMPLPPYIERDLDKIDTDRYQTVYAQNPGSVAAPTAGLHFDEALIENLKAQGVETAFVTLHVGAGTFKPVKTENIKDHKMHSELVEVTADVCHKIEQARAKGGRVIAVGTTSVRCLETACLKNKGMLAPYTGETDIFIYPGYQFQAVDALITNFHLPGSTLLMLVSSLAGRDNIMSAYAEAIEKKYRFFSYGDAMFIS